MESEIDLFRFETTAVGTSRDFVEIGDYDYERFADLDLILSSSNFTQLLSDFTSLELKARLSLAGLPAGVYYAAVVADCSPVAAFQQNTRVQFVSGPSPDETFTPPTIVVPSGENARLVILCSKSGILSLSE